MNNKLQYKCSPDYGEGVRFQHEWKLDRAYLDDIATLQEMVAWCYQNWDDDPSGENEWEYELRAEINCLYVGKMASLSWITLESPKRFYLGTNDEAWAALFKLTWSDAVE
jgi:hypothetical protein